jgi:hypothetical protein
MAQLVTECPKGWIAGGITVSAQQWAHQNNVAPEEGATIRKHRTRRLHASLAGICERDRGESVDPVSQLRRAPDIARAKSYPYFVEFGCVGDREIGRPTAFLLQ